MIPEETASLLIVRLFNTPAPVRELSTLITLLASVSKMTVASSVVLLSKLPPAVCVQFFAMYIVFAATKFPPLKVK